MNESRVGTRELKSKLSEYLRRVKAGETITITDRGKAIVHMVPVKSTIREKILAMVTSGQAEWNGEDLQPYAPKVVNQGSGTISDLIIEDRE
ncbi:MAG: type II toxin-antitoxin system prevent-host-death family antitoxin [Saprospiraceae bacterium]|nr:type II toxin-antitoxin system prevent-host-death family antitoxin [Saprospiraceae bacterium]